MTMARARCSWWAVIAVLLATAMPAAAVAACPDAVTLTATRSVVDLGWSGIAHGFDGGALQLRLGIAGCAGGAPGTCGTCTLVGPLPFADGTRGRCALDASVRCAADADCGTLAPCRVFASPPAPMDAGGIPLCLVNEVVGSIDGTVEPEAGALRATVPLRANLYDGDSVDHPCPTCDAGECVGGARDGLPCTVDATSDPFGATSYDCPPADVVVSPVLKDRITFATAPQSVTLASTSPDCRTVGSTGPPVPKCFCDTCNDLGATPCASNADCVAVGATRCGGRRCIGGANAGAACTAGSACPSGLCGVPGTTQPNTCNPTGSCLANADGDGECSDGPVDQFCAAPESHRGCRPVNQVEDCPLTHACNVARLRRCYLDNGVLGASVTADGAASPPVGDTADVTLGALACGRLTGGNSVLTNPALGFPALLRWRVAATLAFRTPRCTPAPATCRVPTVPGAASLQLRDAAGAAHDRMVWRWTKGAATTEAELGDPRATDAYALCVYDAGVLVAETPFGVADTCGGRSCWRHGSGGFRFGERGAAHGGVHRVVLHPGAGGAARIDVGAGGPGLVVPSVATLTGPLTVQWQRGGGPCWGATFAAPFDRLDRARGTLRDRSE